MASLPPGPDSNAAPRRRRGLPLLVLGGLAALVAGLCVAALFVMRDNGAATPPPASEAGLIIDSSAAAGKIDPGKPLRCFVAGQFVGELSLTECAKRNGVATDALDVGLDANGALVGADQPVQALPPAPPPPQDPVAEPDAPSPPPEASRPPSDPPY